MNPLLLLPRELIESGARLGDSRNLVQDLFVCEQKEIRITSPFLHVAQQSYLSKDNDVVIQSNPFEHIIFQSEDEVTYVKVIHFQQIRMLN